MSNLAKGRGERESRVFVPLEASLTAILSPSTIVPTVTSSNSLSSYTEASNGSSDSTTSTQDITETEGYTLHSEKRSQGVRRLFCLFRVHRVLGRVSCQLILLLTAILAVTAVSISTANVTYHFVQFEAIHEKTIHIRFRYLFTQVTKIFSKGPEVAEYIIREFDIYEQLNISIGTNTEDLETAKVLYQKFYSISLFEHIDTLFYCEFTYTEGLYDPIVVIDRSVTPSVFVRGMNKSINIYLALDESSWVDIGVSRPYQAPTGVGKRIPFFQDIYDSNSEDILWGSLGSHPKVDDGVDYLILPCQKGFYLSTGGEEKTIHGAIMVELSLKSIQEALESLSLNLVKSEQIFIINEKFELFGSSRGSVVTVGENGNTEPTIAMESNDRDTRIVTRYLNETDGLNADLFEQSCASNESSECDFRFQFTFDGLFVHIESYQNNNLKLFFVYTVSTWDFQSSTRNSILTSVTITFVLIIIGVLVGLVSGSIFVVPFENLKRGLKAISELDFSKRKEGVSTFCKCLVSSEFRELAKRLDRTRKVLRMVSGFVPLEVMRVLLTNKQDLEFQKRYISVLFVDLRNFTSISESIDTFFTHHLVEMLNGFFQLVTKAVVRNGGLIDKYIGDCVMALFGAPNNLRQCEMHSISCYFEIINEFEVLQEKWRREHDVRLELTCGINSGYAFCGVFGSRKKCCYSAFGDTVNVSSRLQTQCGAISNKCDVLIGSNVWKNVRRKYLCCFVDRVQLKGKEEPMNVFYPIASKKSLADKVSEKVVQMIEETAESLSRAMKKGEMGSILETCGEISKVEYMASIYKEEGVSNRIEMWKEFSASLLGKCAKREKDSDSVTRYHVSIE